MTKHPCDSYTPDVLSRFVDQELLPEHLLAVKNHLKECRECRALVNGFASLSPVFSNGAQQAVAAMDTNDLQQRLNRKTRPQSSSRTSGRPLRLKLAFLATILLISIVSIQNVFFSVPEPSAIVKSVDTESASVMIIETQKTKHTIIWFSEA